MSKVHNLSLSSSMIHQYIHDLRNVDVQTNRELFRMNTQRIGRAIGWEISKHLNYQSQIIKTPLSDCHQKVLTDEVVSVTILRAGLPLHEGILDTFPHAENGFISAYRKHEEDGSFSIEVEYVACPSLEGKVLILNDPMLATGRSFLNAWTALRDLGTPKEVHCVAVIGSEEGVEYLKNEAPTGFDLWIGTIDPKLNDKKYIVPGLGDAGDLAFGTKMQH